MSENLDLVRSICTAWERGEFRSTAWMHPDIEIVWAQPISPGPTKGVGEGAERFRDFLGTLEAVSFATEEIRVIDHERVLVLGHYRGRGKASGLDIGKISREAALFHVEGGKVTRLVTYWNRDRAFADLGLKDQAMPEESTTPDLEEIWRKSIEAANRGDIDAVSSTFRPDAVWDASALGLGTYQGRAAIRARLEEWMGSFEGYEIVGEEFRDLGNGVTLTVAFQKGHPLGSTGFVELRYAAISIWADGLIERAATYTDIDEARAAAERLAQERG